jgi:kynurenine formamidase
MAIYDLSRTIEKDMLVYPGDVLVSLKKSQISFGPHIGTHVDCPLAYLEGGMDTLEFPLENFVGNAVVIEALKSSHELITVDDLSKQIIGFHKNDIVIVSTGWEDKVGTPEYFEGFPYFEPEVADYLIEKRIKAIGSDTPTPDPPKGGSPFHDKILGAHIGIIEGLINLRPLRNQRIFFCGVPLKLRSIGASPVRAIGILS